MCFYMVSIDMIIDADAHYTPNPDIFKQDPCIADWAQAYHERKGHCYSDIQQRHQELPELGVDKQLLNPMGISLGIDYLLAPPVALHVAERYNDHMKEICHDQRYDWNLWLPLQDRDCAFQELQRHDPGSYFAIFLSDTAQWGFIKNMHCIFDYAQQHRIPLCLHQTHMEDYLPIDQEFHAAQSQLDDIFSKQEFWKKTLASLFCSGVFDRFPDLRFVVAERDIDWVPDFLSTLISAGLGDYHQIMRTNFWYTIEPEMPHFLNTAQILGYDRLLFATDWPHDRDMGGRNSRQDVSTVNALPIDDSARQAIFSNNYKFLKQKL
jgi:predicted TIM-barrel fold metal-dependent hydrolase